MTRETDTYAEEAAAFFVRMLEDDNEQDRQAWRNWMQADARNAVAYCRIAAAWDQAAVLKQVVETAIEQEISSEARTR